MSALNVMIFLRRLRGRLSAAVTNICPGMVKRGEGYFLDNRNQKYQYLSTRGETALAAIGKKRSIAPDGYCGEGAAERARGLSSRASRKPRERAARDQTSRKPRPALGDTAFFRRGERLATFGRGERTRVRRSLARHRNPVELPSRLKAPAIGIILATNRPRESRFRVKGTNHAPLAASSNKLILPPRPVRIADEPLLPPARHLGDLLARVDRLACCSLARALLGRGSLLPRGLAEEASEERNDPSGIPSLDCFVQKALSFNARVGIGFLQPLEPLRMAINFPPVRHRALERPVAIAFRLSREPRPGANARGRDGGVREELAAGIVQLKPRTEVRATSILNGKTARSRRGILPSTHLAREGRMTVTMGRAAQDEALPFIRMRAGQRTWLSTHLPSHNCPRSLPR